MKTLVVNIFGGPGTGKSILTSELFALLKYKGVNCEVAPEFAKELTWEDNFTVLKDQLFLFGTQQHRIFRLNGKVQVLITDSPILLSVVYGKLYKCTSDTFNDLVFEEHYKYDNLNILLTRSKPYETVGRYQDEEEAKNIDIIVKDIMDNLDDAICLELELEQFKTAELLASIITKRYLKMR